MGYNKCKDCEEYHWDNTPCNPVFKVFDEDYMGDDSKEFHAYNHEAAAIKYAQYYNSSDYTLMNNERDVIVESAEGLKKKFTISAEPSIHYSASEIQNP